MDSISQFALGAAVGGAVLAWFTKGFYRVRQERDGIAMTDLRMGVDPWYVFSFRVGERMGGEIRAVPVKQLAPVQVNLDRLA